MHHVRVEAAREHQHKVMAALGVEGLGRARDPQIDSARTPRRQRIGQPLDGSHKAQRLGH